MSGLIGPPAYANVKTPYYLTRTDNLTNDLVSPVNILSADLSKSAEIEVDNANGSIVISPAGNPLVPAPPRYGLNLESGATGIIASLGDSTIASTPLLQLKGQVATVPTTSQVFDEVFNPVDAITPNPQTQIITPTGFSPNFGNIRPIFYDATTNKIVVAQTSLIRFFEVATPEATGENVVIRDPSGNTYSDPEWVCCVAGFANGSGDRTYNVLTIQTAGSPWEVRYDSATTSGSNYVNILAIHRSLLTGG
jgi:hypothetical protein